MTHREILQLCKVEPEKIATLLHRIHFMPVSFYVNTAVQGLQDMRVVGSVLI